MKLKSIEIKGLFGRYDHVIPMHPSGITLLHGPNGVGKSTILKMVDAAVRRDGAALVALPPFREVQLNFQEPADSLAVHCAVQGTSLMPSTKSSWRT